MLDCFTGLTWARETQEGYGDRNSALRRMSVIIKLLRIEVLVKDRLSSHAMAEHSFLICHPAWEWHLPAAICHCDIFPLLLPLTKCKQFTIADLRWHRQRAAATSKQEYGHVSLTINKTLRHRPWRFFSAKMSQHAREWSSIRKKKMWSPLNTVFSWLQQKWVKLEGSTVGQLVQPPAPAGSCQSSLHRIVSRQF